MSTNDAGKPVSASSPLLSDREDDIMAKCSRSVAEFREGLLRQLIPGGMSDEDAAEFLTGNGVAFVMLPDGREELHGFGRKLGDVFSGMESDHEGLKFANRFTPTV